MPRPFSLDSEEEHYFRRLFADGLPHPVMAQQMNERFGLQLNRYKVEKYCIHLGLRRKGKKADELHLPPGAIFEEDEDRWRGLPGGMIGWLRPDGWIDLSGKA